MSGLAIVCGVPGLEEVSARLEKFKKLLPCLQGLHPTKTILLRFDFAKTVEHVQNNSHTSSTFRIAPCSMGVRRHAARLHVSMFCN